MSEIAIYLIQNFASHLLAAIITFFILKCLLQFCNEPCTGSSTARNRPRSTGRRCSRRQDSQLIVRSSRVSKSESSSLNLDRNRSKSKTCTPGGKEKMVYIMSQEGHLQPVSEKKDGSTHNSISVSSETDMNSDQSPLSTENKIIPAESSYQYSNQDNVKSHYDKSGETSPYSKLEEGPVIDPEDFEDTSPDAEGNEEISPRVSKVSEKPSLQPSKSSKETLPEESRVSKEPALRASNTSKKPSQSVLKSSNESLPRQSKFSVDDPSRSLKKSRETTKRASKSPSEISPRESKVSEEVLSRDSQKSKEPSERASKSSKESLPRDSKLPKESSERVSKQYKEPSRSKETFQRSSKLSREPLQRDSKQYKESLRSKEPSRRVSKSSRESLQRESDACEDFPPRGSNMSHEQVCDEYVCKKRSSRVPKVSKGRPSQDSKGAKSIDVANDGSIDSCNEEDEIQTKDKNQHKIIIIDLNNCPNETQRDKPHRSCECIPDNNIVRRTRSKFCHSDTMSEGGSGEWSQDVTTDSCSEMQYGDWSESPYCLRSPSYQMSKKYYDRKMKGKRGGDSDSFKTVIIDFKPGYFLSCFSKCYKKLFSNTSKNNSAQIECKCNCSDCIYKYKCFRSPSKTEERKSQSRSKIENSKSERSNHEITSESSQISPSDLEGDEGPRESVVVQDGENNLQKSHDDPRKSKDEQEDNPRKSKDAPRKSKDKQEDNPRKSKEDPRKSKDKQEDDPRKSQDEKFVAYCNVGVSTSEEDVSYRSLTKHSLDRLEYFRSDPLTSKPKVPEETYNVLSSSSELSESSRYRSQKNRVSKCSYEFLRNDLKAFSDCCNVLPLMTKRKKKQKIYRPKGTSLIGWRKEKTLTAQEMMDKSENSLIRTSSGSSDLTGWVKNNSDCKEKRMPKSTLSFKENSDTEENRISEFKQENDKNQSDFKRTNNEEPERTNSEEKSSIDEEMALELVRSFRTMLSEMAHSTLAEAEPMNSSICRKKYKIKMHPRKRSNTFNNSRSTSNLNTTPKKCKPHYCSDNNIQSDWKTGMKNEDSELPFSHSIKNIVINSSDNEGITIEEDSNIEIKKSIEKNLAELQSLIPSLSVGSNSCTCQRSQRPFKSTSSLEKQREAQYYTHSPVRSDVSSCKEEERTKNKSKHKLDAKKSDDNPRGARIQSSEIEDSIKKRLVNLSALSSLEVLSKAPSQPETLIRNHSTGTKPRDMEYFQKPLKKSKTKNDLSKIGMMKHSKSSPCLDTDQQDETCFRFSIKEKLFETRLSTLNLIGEPESEESNVGTKECCKNRGSDESVGKRKTKFQADDSGSNESTMSCSENTNIYETDDAEGPHEVSLGSLDSKDLSSYTILDLGIQPDPLYSKISLFPKTMHDSFLVLQRKGSRKIHKKIPEEEIDTPSEDLSLIESGPVRNFEKHGECENEETGLRIHEENDEGTSSDSDDDSSEEVMCFEPCEKSERVLRENTYIGHGEGSSNL